MNPKLIDCLIQSVKRLSLVEMLYLKKKKAGIGSSTTKLVNTLLWIRVKIQHETQ